MISDALSTYENEEPADIKNFVERDNGVDALRNSIFREALTYVMQDSKNIERYMYNIIISRYLERCADHSCKMVEKIQYVATGEQIEIK